MLVDKEKKDNYTLITVKAEKLTSNEAPDLKAMGVFVVKEGETNLMIDMSNVDYCDSSGLSSLLVCNRLCNEVSGKFVIAGCNPKVMELLDICQLTRIFNLVESNIIGEKNHF